MVQPHQARRNVARESGEDDKLERSPGLNPVRVERPSFCIFAYVEKQPEKEMWFSFEKTDIILKIGNIPWSMLSLTMNLMLSPGKMQ